MQDWNLLKTNNFRAVSSKFVLPGCLSEVYEMMTMKANIKSLTLEISNDGKIPNEVIGDKHRIQQILINLVQNAISYTS
jgi:signal transduction histidine kinase